MSVGEANRSLDCFHASPAGYDVAILPSHSDEEIHSRFGVHAGAHVAVGHTHVPSLPAGRIWVVNPGAVGFSLDRDWRASYALVDLDTWSAHVRRVEYPVEKAVAMAQERRFCFNPAWYECALRDGWWEPVTYSVRSATMDGITSIQ